MLTDQVHAAGCPVNRRDGRTSKLCLKGAYDLRRNDSHSSDPPKTSSIKPHHKLTLVSASSGARTDGLMTAYSSRITPRSENRKPVGRRRSSMVCLPEQNVEHQEHSKNDNGQRPRSLEPRSIAFVRLFGNTPNQVLQFGIR